MLSHVGCRAQSTLQISPSTKASLEGLPPGSALLTPHTVLLSAELLWAPPLRRGSQHCSKLTVQVGPGMFLRDAPAATSPRWDAAGRDGKEQPLSFLQRGGIFKKAAAASWFLLGHLPEDAERVLCQPEDGTRATGSRCC